MALRINPFTLIALIVVGGVVIVALGVTSVILILRRRHHRALLSMNNTSVRRLSGFPGGNISMADADIPNFPRTRALLRSSTRLPNGYPTPYAAISSSESLPRRQYLCKTSNPLTSNPTTPDRNAHQQSWPLPRRLTRSSNTMIPLAKLKGAGVLTNTERQTDLPRSKTEPRSSYQVAIPTGSPLSEVSPNAALRPKPLSITKKRSVSYGTLPTSLTGAENEARLYVADSKKADAVNIHPPRIMGLTRLCARQSGLAPTEPVPPLPLNIVANNFQSIRSPTENRGSEHSLLSGDTSILNDGFSKCFSPAETDLTSFNIVSPIDPGPTKLGSENDTSFKWDSGDCNRTANRSDTLKQARLRPQLQTEHSFRASIQQYLPRSASSGLSISLLDLLPSHNTSSTTLNKDGSPLKMLKEARGLAKKAPPKRALTPSSPLSRKSMFEIHEDPINKHASTIMQDVSGNIQFGTYHLEEARDSPMHKGINPRPLSIATSDPFQYEQRTALGNSKAAKSKLKEKGHKRQNCVRISNIPVIIPSFVSLLPTTEEPENPSKKDTGPVSKVSNAANHPRPPSRPVFDPILTTPTPAPRASRLSMHPSYSLLNLHNPSPRSSTPSPLSTPTRRPSESRSCAAHPNRRKPIFDAPSPAQFTFTAPEKPPPLPSMPQPRPASDISLNPTNPCALQICKDPSLSAEGKILEPRPSSTLFPFPSPPHPPRAGGPRALPPSAWRRSPTKGRVAKVNASGSWAPPTRVSASPRRDLKKIVAALRRENSDASKIFEFERSDSYRKSHERYCSLGGNEGEGSEDEVDKENIFFYGSEAKSGGMVKKRERSQTCKAFESVLSGPREMPGEPRRTVGGLRLRAETGVKAEEGLYDETGFLRG